jgi:hypothetical protein
MGERRIAIKIYSTVGVLLPADIKTNSGRGGGGMLKHMYFSRIDKLHTHQICLKV